MLEIRNVTKVYRSKTGEEVKALDNVSITFPEQGMVFILGKSGSGKSTLLNVMGGLDSYDSGEFIIKGKSSNDFVGSDFDAYRNTFIGFIFQEYNVLDDFTVGANIGLALELQGKKATEEKINEILGSVDLLNYAHRKPNELSGGQKQRVAIARALVKEPQIIMADEPTGALDSNTGKQIFDTLKELSREKLVLVVSHDRDFAERYADRIIELADGRIIDDVTKHERHAERISEGVHRISDNILRIEGGYKLTAADLEMINAYLSKANGDIILSGDGRVNEELRSAAGISKDGSTTVFEGTDAQKDIKTRTYQKEETRFIRSRLPMKNAVKMGSSGLKHKKFRLVITILLSLISFAMFGLADTMAAYEKIGAATESIIDSNVNYAAMRLGVRHKQVYVNGEEYIYHESAALNDDDIAYLKNETGLNFVPVYTGSVGWDSGFSMGDSFVSYQSNQVYTGKMAGLVHMTEDMLTRVGLTVSGRLPTAEGEIAISELLFRQLNEYGFKYAKDGSTVRIEAGQLQKDGEGEKSILGKPLSLKYTNGGYEFSYTVVGVVDTSFDYDRYQTFLPSNQPDTGNEGNGITEMVLAVELENVLSYSFHALGFAMAEDIVKISEYTYRSEKQIGTYMHGWSSSTYLLISRHDETGDSVQGKSRDIKVDSVIGGGTIVLPGFGGSVGFSRNMYEVANSSSLADLRITWFDGTPRELLGQNEILVSEQVWRDLQPSSVDLTLTSAAFGARVDAVFGEGAWAQTDENATFGARLVQAYQRTSPDGDPTLSAYRTFLPQINDMLGISLTEEDLNHVLWQIDEFFNTFNANDESESISLTRFTDLLRHVYVSRDLLANNYFLDNEKFVRDLLACKEMDVTKEEWDSYSDTMDYGNVEQCKPYYAERFYRDFFLSWSEYDEYEPYAAGAATRPALEEKSREIVLSLAGKTEEELLGTLSYARMIDDHRTGTTSTAKEYDFKIVGTFKDPNYNYSNLVVSDTLYNDYMAWYESEAGEYAYKEEVTPHDDGIWSFALAPLSADAGVIERLVTMSYDGEAGLQFQMQNAVMNSLSTFNDFIEVGAQIFVWVGLGFALFSSLLLMNFIAISISYKKREIGILRAVGARSSDVFKIFFSEALIIALINFAMSVVALLITTTALNTWMRNSGINVTLLNVGVRQFALMLLVSVAVALLASFLPVYKIAKKKPVDAIKDR